MFRCWTASQARPDWHFILVGPVVKIDPADLPRGPDIHYFGQRTYQELPAFLTGWDVCLCRTHATKQRDLSAPPKPWNNCGGKADCQHANYPVAEPYGNIVYLASTPEEFVAACSEALTASAAERTRRVDLIARCWPKTSWDKTAQRISKLLDQTAASRRTLAVNAPPDTTGEFHDEGTAHIRGRYGVRTSTVPPVVVVGAGPTGLGAAYHLGEEALLLEQNQRVGGWCRSIPANGFTFDFAGHIMFSNDPVCPRDVSASVNDNVHWQDREAWIFSKGVYTRYPFQGALYGLPPDVIKECILGVIEARFGPLKKAETNGGRSFRNGLCRGQEWQRQSLQKRQRSCPKERLGRIKAQPVLLTRFGGGLLCRRRTGEHRALVKQWNERGCGRGK